MSDKDQDKPDEKTLLSKDEPEKPAADGNIADGQPPVDESKVKFIGNGGASAEDVKVELGTETESGKANANEFTGLTKEELMQYSNDPFWVKMRWALLILFWVGWFGMLAAAIIIIVLAPKCPPRPKMEWYQKSVAYKAMPRSFKDSNGDGIGDLKGLHNKKGYIKEQVKGNSVWINSILQCHGFEYGQDVTDYQQIDAAYGTMEDFRHMRIAMHKAGMKLIMDFVPNHSSNQHPWFVESSKNKLETNKYRDYYVWADPKMIGGRREPPNNWKSIYGGSAWEYVGARNQYYLHQYFKEEPDLNLRNPDVRTKIQEAIKFWYKEVGVDGISILGAPYLVESLNITSDEPSLKPGNGYDSLNHTLTKNQPETFEIITEWRKVADEVQGQTDKPRALIVQGDDSSVTMFHKYQDKDGAHMVINSMLTNIDRTFNNQKVLALLQERLDVWSKDRSTFWMLGNADVKRVASRVSSKNLNGLQMLLMTMPGAPIAYYGDEIGMTSTPITNNQMKDPLGKIDKTKSRDGERTPMQWNNKNFAGFTSGNSTWLPVNPNYTTINVKSATAAGSTHNHYEAYQKVADLHNKESIQWGELSFIPSPVVAYTRQAEGFAGFLVAINFDVGTSPTLDFVSKSNGKVAAMGKVVANTADVHGDLEVNKTVDLSNVIIVGGTGVVFEWEFSEVKK